MEHEELLKEEYLHLQKVIEDFDSKTITIKAWSVTGSLVAIGAAFSENSDVGGSPLFLIGAFSSLLFWIIEGNWKGFQLCYYRRITQIEEYFRDSHAHYTPAFQISCQWGESWDEHFKRRRIEHMFWPAVMLPHVVIFVGGILLFFFCDCKIV